MQMRKLATTALGAMLAGATFAAPALAATLADLPSPFVKGGVADFTIVVGSTAASSDVLGAVDIAARFGGEAVSVSGGSDVGKVSGGAAQTQNVLVGASLGNSTNFGTALTNSDLNFLTKSGTRVSISIGSVTNDYSVADEITISSTVRDASIETALSTDSANQNLKDNVFLRLNNDGLKYRHIFNDQLKAGNFIANASTSSPVILTFMGKRMEIIGGPSATSVRVKVGDKARLKAGESVTTAAGKKLTMIQTSSSKALVDVDGVSQSISEGSSLRVGTVDVFVDTIFDDTGSANDQALLIYSDKDAVKTYSNDDEFIGEDKTNPNWKWEIGGILTATPSLNVSFAQTVDSSDDKMLTTVGKTLCMPTDCSFAKVSIDRLTASAWQQYEFTSSTEELKTYGGDAVVASSGRVIKVRSLGGTSDGFKVTDDAGTTRQTDEIAITQNGTNATLDIYWKDKDNGGVFKRAIGNTINTGTSVTFNYQNGKPVMRILANENVSLAAAGEQSLKGSFIVQLVGVNDKKNTTLSFVNSTAGTGGYTYVGASQGDTTVTNDIVYGDRAVAGTRLDLSGFSETTMTPDGVKVYTPKTHSPSDKYVIGIPDQFGADFKARVTFAQGDATTSTSSGTKSGVLTTSVSKLDTEIADATKEKNLILVGGPCVNRLTAQAMGKTFPACGADSGIATNGYLIRLVENAFTTGKSALIVAGWEAADSREAAAKVQQFGLIGMEIVG